MLFGLDFEKDFIKLKDKKTKFEQIDLLKEIIRFSNIEKGMAHYECNNDCPVIWRGVLDAKFNGVFGAITGFNSFKNEREEHLYKQGKRQWDEYCKLKQLLNDLENNKNIITTNQKKEAHITKGFSIKKSSQKDYLKDIHIKLIEKGYIENSIKLTEFKKIFSNTNLNELKPINWINSIASLNGFIKLFNFEISAKERKSIIINSFIVNGNKLSLEQITNNKVLGKKDNNILNSIFKHYPQ